MPQINQLNLRDTYGAGKDDAQRETFNALRMDAQRQGIEQNATVFDEQMQRSNTEWLAGATKYAIDNPNALPGLIQEGKRRKVLAPDLDISQVPPDRMGALLTELHQNAVAALGGIPKRQIGKSDIVPVQGNQGSEYVLAEDALGRAPVAGSPSEAKPPASISEYNLYAQQEQAAGRQPISFYDFRKSIQQQEAAGRGAGAGLSKSQREYIDVGQRQADASIILRRGLELLDIVDTGKPEEIALAARNMFGIAGADETELNANLGKAILSQLRDTFGAQFTQQEGERLEYIEANFGKSTPGNKRLLQQALKISERAARRGLAAAKEAGDTFAAQEIQASLDFKLSAENEQISDFQKQWDDAPSGAVLRAPDGTLRKKP